MNPSGKYCIRLYINGCWRTVFIDTMLPFARDRILCSYSKDLSELWVSLIEKAYMKVMGNSVKNIRIMADEILPNKNDPFYGRHFGLNSHKKGFIL